MLIPRTEGDDLAVLSHSLRGIPTSYSLQLAEPELAAGDLRAIAPSATLPRINGAIQLAALAILAVAWALVTLKFGTIAIMSIGGLVVLAACVAGACSAP